MEGAGVSAYNFIVYISNIPCSRKYQMADAYRDVAILKRVTGSWKTARDRIRVGCPSR